MKHTEFRRAVSLKISFFLWSTQFVIERRLYWQLKITELSLKCTCHSAHFSRWAVNESRISAKTEMLVFFLLGFLILMRDHKSHVHVVKKLYFFKNIAVNSSASIREIKLKVIIIMEVYTKERFILWHVMTSHVWLCVLKRGLEFEMCWKGQEKRRVVKYMNTFLWCVLINSKLIDCIYGI